MATSPARSPARRNVWSKLLQNGAVAEGDIIDMHIFRDPARVPQPMLKAHSVVHKVQVGSGGICCLGDKAKLRQS